MLTDGLAKIATSQIRNVATIAGDLSQEKRCWFFRSGAQCYKAGGMSCPCYAVLGDNRHHSILGAGRCAAPCVADAAPILTALDAFAVVVGIGGTRRVPLRKFYVWSGETVVRPGEIIRAIEVPRDSMRSTQAFEKSAGWDGDFADASVAVHMSWDGAALSSVRISLGAVSPLPVRAVTAETALLKRALNAETIRAAAEMTVHGALPLADNKHKSHLLVNLTERAIERCLLD